MNQNLWMAVWILIVIVTLWFLGMVGSRYWFFYTDTDPVIRGAVAINDTDVGTQCGVEEKNMNEILEYKLSQSGKIIYLCPLGWWPIQQRVTAVTLTDNFRRTLPAEQLNKINAFYPGQTQSTQAISPIHP